MYFQMELQTGWCRGHFMSARTPKRRNFICKGIYPPCEMVIASAMFRPRVYSPRMGLRTERCRGHFMSARTPERRNMICNEVCASCEMLIA